MSKPTTKLFKRPAPPTTTGDMLTILDNCRISPPPGTVGNRSLRLTFFDTTWLLFFPIHQVFFYKFPHSRDHFLETIVPNLKHSLSITLQHFFPFSGNLIVFPKSDHHSKNPEIRHVEGDAIPVAFAECDLDFDDLTGNQPRKCDKFYPLVPMLGRATKVSESDCVSVPLFTVQVTLFPNSGIAIGLTNHHSLCDATTRYNFLKAWTSIARHGTDELFLASDSLPLYERVIEYPNSLDEIYMSQPGIEAIDDGYRTPELDTNTDKVRVTIILTQTDIKRLKKWVSTRLPNLDYISTFSMSCAYIWSCIAKSKSRSQIADQKEIDDGLERFICAVDWRSRFDPPIPQTYFGNCVGPCITSLTKTGELAGDDGFLRAAELFGTALSETVRKRDGLIKDAETWIERAFEPVPTTGVSGTPKIKIYDVDFGFGKAVKHETVAIDYNGSISVNACRDSPADIEIGVSLPAKQMVVFVTIVVDELEQIGEQL